MHTLPAVSLCQRRWSFAALALALVAIAALVSSPLASARPTDIAHAPAHGIVAQTDGLTSLALTDTNIAFSAAELNAYDAWEPSDAVWASTHVVAVFASGSASYTVNGGAPVVLASGVASPEVVLSQGVNAAESTTTIVVTHVSGQVSTVYTVRVYRHAWAAGTPVSATVDGVPLTLIPDTSTSAVRGWHATVPYSTTRVVWHWQGVGSGRLTTDCGSSSLSLTVPVDATCGYDLSVGNNGHGMNYRAFAANDDFQSYYGINIIREGPLSPSTVSSLTLADSNISLSDSSSEMYAFNAWEPSDAVWASTHVVAVFASGSASYTVNGGAPVVLASGVASPEVVLSQGVNAAESTTTIVVTHVSGQVSTVYTVRVYRHAWAAGTPVSATVDGVPLTLIPDTSTSAVRGWHATVPYSTTRVVWHWQGVGSGRLTTDCGSSSLSLTVPVDATCGYDLSVGNNGHGMNYRAFAANDDFQSYYGINIIRASQFAEVPSIDLGGDGVSDDAVPSGSTMEAVAELTGTPTPTATYQWQEADAVSEVTLRGMLATPSIGTQSVVWTDISGANARTFTPTAAQVGKYVRVKITASNGVSEPQVNTSTPRRVVAGAATPQEQPQEQPRSPDPVSPGNSSPLTPPVFSPAPGIALGEARGEAALAPAVPAAGADLLRGANIWVRQSSKVEYVLPLPNGLKLVDGKLVASKPGTYKVKIKVKRANGTVKIRKITVKVG